MLLHAKGPSKWQYDTSAGHSFGFSREGFPITATKTDGHLKLISPEGKSVRFDFSFVGGSASLSLNKKRLNLGPFSFSGSIEKMWSTGLGNILIGAGFGGSELAATDFEGFCVAQEISGAFGFGGSATIFAMGIPLTKVPLTILSETGLLGAAPDLPGGSLLLNAVAGPLGGWLVKKAIHAGHMAPKAIVRAFGTSSGWQAGLSGSQSVGLVTLPSMLNRILRPAAAILEVPPSPEGVSIRSKSSAQVELVILGDALFKFDDDQFKTESTKDPPSTAAEIDATRRALDHIGEVIRGKAPRRIAVVGHTDIIEHTPGWNQKLSERRANTMRQWLIRNTLMDPAKVDTYGEAATKPVADNATKEGRAKNRRVVLELFYG